ncbi:hypothetical protein BC628DRAFT_1417924 [Trametes gibbosa]|nr:hypothetical protein BC628DRAFT_1417924 [Trametes gibbosa]
MFLPQPLLRFSTVPPSYPYTPATMRTHFSLLSLALFAGLAIAAPLDSADLVARGLPNGRNGADYKRSELLERSLPNGQHSASYKREEIARSLPGGPNSPDYKRAEIDARSCPNGSAGAAVRALYRRIGRSTDPPSLPAVNARTRTRTLSTPLLVTLAVHLASTH